ncbi:MULTISPECIES: PD-(D/E)XK nuclease family protein [unclassified Treponema]|uniref:PD-(D/E)XK nuclease family protein n=1 Tax=unclassified Treponema TaxID=2638727 RepID=UPI0020A45436|nr:MULTISPECIES: PD-(D/E)XK nuclease family protein [unclassified Treponema]UTC66615.1 PD-(D/E)XK nuclease family protein [Treponema sp. OMZ 789]UTC69347.1 PD-(D/E)XK nuclease family protein [Treponema sp. OMZ 790]UTC72062.1 PD-(D/E)XK nuclease family protein [Treponema sp. OMZ 791]
MDLIEKTIKTYGRDLNNVFVFPSRIAARLWFQKSLSITGLGTIPLENYMSWDGFKEACLISQVSSLSPVSNTVRRIFAGYISRLNSEKAKTAEALFKSLIPENYAETGAVFSEWIAGILPQLDHFEKRYTDKGEGFSNDDEMKDYILLKNEYTEFLKENSLFEPSWVSSEFYSNQKKYIIIFPELMEDFAEHAELLDLQKDIIYVPCPKFNQKENLLDVYKNSRNELKNTVLQIEKLLSEGVRADEIAVSVPDIENYAAYIKREFYLRGIPAEFRSGFNLGLEQAGKLFSLIYDCVQNNFSFEFMKPIVLNKHIPWKDAEGAEALIDYGVKNNCAVSWKENKEDDFYKNIWIESFKINYEKDEAEIEQKKKARDWFYSFYYAVNRICESKTFNDLQKNYFLFRKELIDETRFSQKDNAILGRCISCLQELLYLEDKFERYMPADRFKFFISELDKAIYVPQNTGLAVSVFPYRVAAAAPFAYHFILNCSQEQTNIIYNKLSFLRKDKREALGVFETDASPFFFEAYTASPNTVFSFSPHSFSSYLIVNNLFEMSEDEEIKNIKRMNKKIEELKSYDSFIFDYSADKDIEMPEDAVIYKIQKNAALAFSVFKEKKDFSYLDKTYDMTCKEVNSYIEENLFKDGAFKLSQTDLKTFTECPSSWFLKKVLSVFDENYDAHIFDARNIGNLSHSVLEALYIEIGSTDKYFNSDNLDRYMEKASSIFDDIAEKSMDFRGGLAKPFIQSLKKRVMEAVNFVLENDAKFLNGYYPKWVEEWIEIENNGILYRGKIDRASFPQDERSGVIIDYKTNNMPAYSSYGKKGMNADDIELTDFQIPMYIFLAESKLNQTIEHAWFLSFVQQKINKVVNDNEVIPVARNGAERTRDDFQSSIDSFIKEAERFAELVNAQDFTRPSFVSFETCKDCNFKHICRIVYSVK